MLHTFLKIILRIISTLRFNPVAPQKQCSLRRFNVRINILHVKWRSLLFCFSNSTLTTTTGTPEPPVLLSSCNITALTSLESGGPYGTIWTWLMGQVENEKPKKTTSRDFYQFRRQFTPGLRNRKLCWMASSFWWNCVLVFFHPKLCPIMKSFTFE